MVGRCGRCGIIGNLGTCWEHIENMMGISKLKRWKPPHSLEYLSKLKNFIFSLLATYL
jgi:hypothetical protein